MAFGSAGGSRQSLTEINVTPLVDVMLVLLIVFMVTAPLIQQGVQVKLPQTPAKSMPSDDQKLVLSLRADRSVWLGTTEKPAEVPLRELEQKLRANERLQRDAALYIMADRALPYGFVVEVFATAQRAGVTNIGLITDPREDRR